MPDEVVTAQESAEAPVLTPAPTIPGGLTMWNDTKLMNLAYRTAGMLSRSGLVPDSYALIQQYFRGSGQCAGPRLRGLHLHNPAVGGLRPRYLRFLGLHAG